MANDWMLDVLADLKSFAESNGLGATERQLEQVMITVSDELRSMRGFAQGTVQNISHVGDVYRAVTESRNS